MSKDYTANKVHNLMLRIKFSTPSDPVYKNVPDPEDKENTIREYYAAMQILQCQAKNGIMTVPVHVERKYYGSAKLEAWTAKEVGDAIKTFSNLNTNIYNDVKALYLDAISEDIS